MENKKITDALKIILCDIFESLQSVGGVLVQYYSYVYWWQLSKRLLDNLLYFEI